MTLDAHRAGSGLDRYAGMLDARERVTGRVPYVIDLVRPRMLHAKMLRSTAQHARIRSIDTSRAAAVPGVHAVLTGADIEARTDVEAWYGPVLRDQPILAIGKVRYVGEPIAAVAAVDLDTAQEALDLIDVVYEELPAADTIEDALADDAPLVHEEPPRTGATFADLIVDTKAGTNLCNHFRLRKGDVERGFAEADRVFEGIYTRPAVQHVPMETHACIAEWSGDRLTLWDSTQMPFITRAFIAEVFHVPQTNVRVIVPTLGGGYGAKTYLKLEPLTALLAKITRRPVRIHLTREEEFLTITNHGIRTQLRTAVRADGTITAREAICHFDTGAYGDIGPRLIKNGGYAHGGPHRIANIAIDSYAVYTNRPPAGAFRGYGVNQAAWAYETQMDEIAEALGIDPVELRMRNLLDEGDSVMTGEPMVDARFKELLGNAVRYIGWDPAAPVREVRGRKARAKGVTIIIKGTVTPSTSTASAKLNEDGTLDVLMSSVEMGQGVKTAMAILAGERLGLAPDRVHVSEPDTDVTPYDQQTSSSRTSHAMGTAVQGAVDEIVGQLLALASERLEIAVSDLEIAAGTVRAKGSPERAIGFADLVRGARLGNLLGSHTLRTEGGLDPETGQGIGSVHWHQASGAAEVEVDLDTGKVEVLRYQAGVYAGRIINPAQAELQTEGNIAFGLSQALFEELVFDGGQLQNGNLGDYMITSIEDMPRDAATDVVEHPETGEIHGIGEVSLPPVVPAIGNAIYRATGVRVRDLPITAEKLLRGIRALEGREVAE